MLKKSLFFLFFAFLLNINLLNKAHCGLVDEEAYDTLEVSIGKSFTAEDLDTLPCIREYLGDGQLQKHPRGNSGCNQGLYVHKNGDSDEEIFLKVVGRSGYEKEKKAFEIVKNAGCDHFIVIPRKVFLFEDFAVLAMEKAQGAHILLPEDMLAIPEEGLAAFAKVVADMCTKGVKHNDFHFANILFDKVKNVWKVIDTETITQAEGLSSHHLEQIFNLLSGTPGNMLIDMESLTKTEIFEKTLPTVMKLLSQRDRFIEKLYSMLPNECVEQFEREQKELIEKRFIYRYEDDFDKLRTFYALSAEERVSFLLNKLTVDNEDDKFFSPRNYRKFAIALTREHFFKTLIDQETA